jgi:hypothetical protein
MAKHKKELGQRDDFVADSVANSEAHTSETIAGCSQGANTAVTKPAMDGED